MKDPTREAAFALLCAVLDRHHALDTALDALPPLDPRDRAAAHRLAAAVLRRLGTLDAVTEPFLTKAPPARLRHVLRIGVAGLLLLDTPAHAAVATAVALARAVGLVPFAGLVNAVLRRVSEAGAAVLEGLDSARLDTPPWLWRSWGADARAIATAQTREAPLDLTLMPGAVPPPGGFLLPGGSVRFPAGTAVAGLAGFAEGGFWVQDAAAALPATLLAAGPGELVADLCAAPGGKTLQLAATGARVTAVDRDPARLVRLAENLARLRLAAEIVAADITAWTPPALFDAILLDAPCSATGTMRRHPDVGRLRRPRDVAALAQQQDQMIAAACAMLRPGGRLIFSVCSLQPDEAGPRVAQATARLPLTPDRFRDDELPWLTQALTAEGTLRTHPGMWPEHGGMDGFFAARMIREGAE